MGRRLIERQERSISGVRPRKFIHVHVVGDKVYTRNYHGTQKWFPAKITKAMGPVSYQVYTTTGLVWRRHVDQLRYQHDTSDELEDCVGDKQDLEDTWSFPEAITSDHSIGSPASTSPVISPPIVRRSSHRRTPVDRYIPH